MPEDHIVLKIDGKELADIVTKYTLRKAMSGAAINDLPDDAFAYIEPGGEKDDEGKTTPRSLRHYPVHDEAHAKNAYARASAQIQNDGAGKAIAQKAMPKIKSALKKFGVDTKTAIFYDDSTHPSVAGVGAACPGCGSNNPAKSVDGEMRCPDCEAYRGDAGYNAGDGTQIGGGAVNPAGVPDGTGSTSNAEPAESRSCGCGGEARSDGVTFKSVDELAEAFAAFVTERASSWVVMGEDGSEDIDASVSSGDTSPHPADDDDELADSRTPDEDEGDSVDDGSDTEPAGASSDGEDGSTPVDADVGTATTPPHPENDDDQGEDQREDPNVDEGDSVEDGQPYPDPQAGESDQRNERRRYKTRRSNTPAPKPEHRARASEVEVRTASGDDGPIHSGAAIVYNAPYTVYDAFGAFTERMAPSVCDRVLASGDLDCRYLINHEGIPLARTTSRTLELDSTMKSLDMVAHLSANSTLAADLTDAIARRDITQMSVGFRVAEDEWDDDYMNRTVHSFADLLDVSSVTYPASPTTSVDVAKRMLFSLSSEGRAGVAEAYRMVCDVRSGSSLDRDCSDFVLRALETLYSVDDPRIPLVRVREAWKIARDIRAGKKLNASNAGFIAAALESLHRADDVDLTTIARSLENVDDALDEAMDALSSVSGLPNPDDDDQNSDPGEGIRSRELALEEAADRRRRAAKAQRSRLRLKTRPTK